MTAARTPPKVLIIDDEHELCALLSDYLRDKGYEPSSAFSGAEGLEKLRAERFHLVLTDIRMPGLSGLATLEEIKRLDPSIEVILMTAFGDAASAALAMKLGAYDFIEKPFALEQLWRVAEEAMSRRQLRTVKGLEETAAAVFSTPRLEDLLPLLTDLALAVAPAEDAFIALPKDGALELSAWSATQGAPSLAFRLRAAEVVARRGAPGRCLAAVPSEDPRFDELPGAEEVRFLLAYPMAAQGAFLGVLGLCRTRGADPFSAEETRNVSQFAALVTQALRSATLYRTLEDKLEALRLAEERAIQSEKMAALGRISSGLAHELKNPITGILLNAQLLLERLREPELAEAAKDVELSARRCNDIIENLLGYARAGPGERGSCELASLLDEALDAVARHPGLDGIAVRKDYSGGAAPALANGTQLRQVLVNVLLNARQAMPGGGRLTLRVLRARARRETLRRWTAPGAAAVLRDIEGLRERDGEEWAIAALADDGSGIQARDLPLIFEPFFTTKPAGEGLGLGLYLSYEIVNANGGAIWASSPGPGQGSTFFIALPIVPSSQLDSRERARAEAA